MLTQKRLKALLLYDPETGIWTWKLKRKRVNQGDIAGRITNRGRRQICVDCNQYYSSRLAWLYMTGEWPKNLIDHKNRNTLDDRWENLREATHRESNRNRGIQRRNRSGFKGVHFRIDRRYWVANIRLDKLICLGRFETAEAAHAAYVKAAKEFHGEYAGV